MHSLQLKPKQSRWIKQVRGKICLFVFFIFEWTAPLNKCITWSCNNVWNVILGIFLHIISTFFSHYCMNLRADTIFSYTSFTHTHTHTSTLRRDICVQLAGSFSVATECIKASKVQQHVCNTSLFKHVSAARQSFNLRDTTCSVSVTDNEVYVQSCHSYEEC